MICDETLININEFPDFSLPKNVKDYERFSLVTGEKQETESVELDAVLERTYRSHSPLSASRTNCSNSETTRPNSSVNGEGSISKNVVAVSRASTGIKSHWPSSDYRFGRAVEDLPSWLLHLLKPG